MTMMPDAALTRTHRKRFHYSGAMDTEFRAGNRRRRTVPAMEPKRAADEIAVPCMCAIEIRAAGELL